ncbi:aromatic hydrocarbon degradation protein [Moheibacter lacus]|uniref:Aromatic hydrocarbon degradation protein n=1 Tax=Moheibacter lacus TaxID=2745851 RepID=A0A838ZS58_9FLAO|nr:aromatic hydrocarbon degradation protein [Moheibacter lacus]MBA5628949.1 aromatic hydrocarbon degradation protein [Moheibacter lacus]
MKIKSVLVVLGMVGMGIQGFAQSISTSPYSAFGVGSLLFDNNIEQAAMGGISVFNTNPYSAGANFYNPAANKDLNVTSFDLGVNTHMSQFDDGSMVSKKSTTYLSNVSLAFPVGTKARAGFGFQPYSSIGYDLSTITEGDELRFRNDYKGEGGVNSFHVMGSYNVSPEFSVGVRANYLFGDLNRHQIITTEGLALVTDYSYEAKLSGFQFTAGTYYSKKIGTNKHFEAGGTYTLGANVNARIEDMTSTYMLMDNIPQNIDTIQYHKIYGDMKLPQSVSIGASYRKDLHWMFGAQLDWGDWGAYQMDEADNSNIDTRFRISAGGYWIPNFNSYKSYFDRVTYRLGGFYEATPLQFGEVGIKKYGMTVGFGFPVGKDRDASMLNLAVELGQLGKPNSSVIQENYANVKIGFTLNDIWFRKRVID